MSSSLLSLLICLLILASHSNPIHNSTANSNVSSRLNTTKTMKHIVTKLNLTSTNSTVISNVSSHLNRTKVMKNLVKKLNMNSSISTLNITRIPHSIKEPIKKLKELQKIKDKERKSELIDGLLRNISVETLIEILKYKQLTNALNVSVIAKIKETISSLPLTTTTTTTPRCPPNSSLKCPTRCDPTCKRPLSTRSTCPQPTMCLQKECVCNSGYVKNDDGVCVHATNCSAKCRGEEVFKLCPTACPIHCGNINDPPKECTEDLRDDYQCLADCVCRQDLVRDLVTNHCVPKSNCTKVSPYPCPPNEHYEESGPSCEKYCHQSFNATTENEYCNKKAQTTKKGCFCNSGHIRLNLYTRCIREDECLLMLKYT